MRDPGKVRQPELLLRLLRRKENKEAATDRRLPDFMQASCNTPHIPVVDFTSVTAVYDQRTPPFLPQILQSQNKQRVQQDSVTAGTLELFQVEVLRELKIIQPHFLGSFCSNSLKCISTRTRILLILNKSDLFAVSTPPFVQ